MISAKLSWSTNLWFYGEKNLCDKLRSLFNMVKDIEWFTKLEGTKVYEEENEKLEKRYSKINEDLSILKSDNKPLLFHPKARKEIKQLTLKLGKIRDKQIYLEEYTDTTKWHGADWLQEQRVKDLLSELNFRLVSSVDTVYFYDREKYDMYEFDGDEKELLNEVERRLNNVNKEIEAGAENVKYLAKVRIRDYNSKYGSQLEEENE